MNSMDMIFRDITINKAIKFAFNNPSLDASSMSKEEAVKELSHQTKELEHARIDLDVCYQTYHHLDMPYDWYLQLFGHTINCVRECQRNQIKNQANKQYTYEKIR